MKRFSKGCLIAFGVVAAAMICLVVIGVLVSLAPSSNPEETKQEEIQPTKAVASSGVDSPDSIRTTATPDDTAQAESVEPTEVMDIPTEVPIVDNAPSFEEICANSTTGGQTELVWDNFKKETEGKYFVERFGIVQDVDQGLFGGYSLIINVGKSYGSCSLDIRIEVSEEESKDIKVGQEILFSGEIFSMSEFFSDVSISLKDGTYVTDPEIVKPVADAQKPPLGTIGEAVECGTSFTVTVLEPPEFLNALGYGNTATGQYLVLKLEIMNNTGSTFDGFQEDNFSIDGSLSGNQVRFSANWDPSYYAARRQFGYKYLGDELPPSLSWKTQVVFDINPDATDLVFTFAPKDNMFDLNNMCEVGVSLSDTP